MRDPSLDSLDPELGALLAGELEAQPSEQARERMWSRLAGSIGTGAANDEGTPGATNTGQARGLRARPYLAAALGFVAGAAAWANLNALVRPSPPARTVYVDRPVIVTGAPAATAETLPVPQVSATAWQPIPHPPASRSAPQTAAPSSLSAERALLDEARGAISQNDGPRALELASEHAHRFAQPQLGEEREAIAIQALILEHRYDEARARATRFRSMSPNSLLLPAVDASLATIP